jgi:hypothetical protein
VFLIAFNLPELSRVSHFERTEYNVIAPATDTQQGTTRQQKNKKKHSLNCLWFWPHQDRGLSKASGQTFLGGEEEEVRTKKKKKKNQDESSATTSQTTAQVVFALDHSTHLSPTIAHVQELPPSWRLDPIFFNKTLTPQNVTSESTLNASFATGNVLDATCPYN